MSKNYRIAIVGVGAIAGMHAQSIADLPNATLVAANCRTQGKGEAFASKWDCKWYSDYETMLDEAKPDLVTVCTPSGAHLEPVQACAKRGIHVLCEKPLEITAARIDQMIDAANQGGILLGGIFPQRYNPVMQVLYEAAAKGRFGSLAAISVSVPWWRDDAYYAPERWQGSKELDGGGAYMNQSIHSIDLLQWLAGATMPELDRAANPLEEVFCYTARRSHDENQMEVEDTAVSVGKFRSGALAHILGATSMYPGSHRSITIAGRDGTVQITEDEITKWEFREALPEDDEIRAKFGGSTEHGGGASDPMAIDHSHHRSNIADFLEAIEQGTQPTIDAVEARKAVAIIEACYASAEAGKPIAPPAPATV